MNKEVEIENEFYTNYTTFCIARFGLMLGVSALNTLLVLHYIANLCWGWT